MITVAAVLKALYAAGVTLDLQGDKLRVAAPSGAMTDDLRQAIAQNKRALIEAITGEVRRVNSQTGQRFVTRLAKCNRCGLACWGPTGEPDLWGCLVCADAEILNERRCTD